jgi:ubiquinone/menaquinone biosynthesis C-methylase UbiE
MQAMDITNIPIDDDTYDTVICNHVLEHIPNDIKALKELFRVIKPGGWGSIQVPIKGDITDEDLSITDPEERTKRYGQSDHVRQYGKDFIDRLPLAGFTVSVIPKETLFDKDFLKQLSVEVEKDIILVRKPTITT